MKWIIITMCVQNINNVPVICTPPIAYFDSKQDCMTVEADLNKHEKSHYYCVPEQPKEKP
jgi:hypothetical protein